MDTLTCYKNPMPKRSMREEDKKNEVLGVSVSAKTKDFVTGVAEEEERSLSYIGGALLLRGIAAYLRDGQLKEPSGITKMQPEMVDAVIVKGYQPRKKSDKKTA